MKAVIVNLLNVALRAQGMNDVTVVELSDDFETAIVRHDNGSRGVVKSEVILPDTGEHHAKIKPVNRGINAGEVQRIRNERIDGIKNARNVSWNVRSGRERREP